MSTKIFFDGGCRPNPGAMEIAVVVRGRAYYRLDIGDGTNSEAEWRALSHALEVARMLGLADVILIGDSAQVINQAKGISKARDPVSCKGLADFAERAPAFSRLRMRQIGRAQNLAGIALEKALRNPGGQNGLSPITLPPSP